MSNTTTETTIDRAEQQAIAQVDTIVELVRRLDRETSAEDFVKNLGDDEAITLWRKYNGPADERDAEDDVECDDVDEVRDNLVEHIARQMLDPEDYSFQYNFSQDSDDALDEIMEDPLEITYRTGWLNHSEVCDGIDKGNIEECCILLCTGGPAVRILCDADRGSLASPRVQYQDWGVPWTELLSLTSEQRSALDTYISNFEIQ